MINFSGEFFRVIMLEQAIHAHKVMTLLNQQRAVGQFCDAKLNTGTGHVYLAHRNVLACFSQLFQELNLDNPQHIEINLPLECPLDGLERLLDYFYTGELKLEAVSLERVQRAASAISVANALLPGPLVLSQASAPSEASQMMSRSERKPITSVLPLEGQDETPTKGRSRSQPTVRNKNEPGTHPYSPESSGTTTHIITTTTTRSGRKVKGPSWLVGEASFNVTSPGSSTRREVAAVSKEEVHKENDNSLQPMSEVLVQLDAENKNVDSEMGSDTCDENDEEDMDGAADAVIVDTDEEYIPSNSPTTAAPPRARKKGKAKASDEDSADMPKGNKKGSVECPTCHKTFLSKYYLKVHNRRHTGEKPFRCEKCGKCYYRKENLQEHEARNCQSRADVVFSCNVCPMKFQRRQQQRIHMVIHTGEMPNKCTSCSEQFMQKKDLRSHMIKVHGAPKPHACSLCPKCFLSRTELRLHEASKHRGEKLFVCEECGHRASSRNGLQMHIKAIHRNERPFVCEFCNHAFTQKANLNMHLRTHTGEKPFQCHLCGKTFRTQASLDKHHRTHTGERPFACEFCEQRFTEKGPLHRHVASKHQEGRPHYCHICSKTFKAVEQLRVHVRRHKGMRKFQCTECGYKFTRQAHLRRHYQIHNRVENYNPRQRRLRNLVVEEDAGAAASEPARKDSEQETPNDSIISVMIQPAGIVGQEVVVIQDGPPKTEREESTIGLPGPSTETSGQGNFEVMPLEGGSNGEEQAGFNMVDIVEQSLLVSDAGCLQQNDDKALGESV
ncbi:telomere zinc finger-associated protein isoform X2 [Denticeps clupeoides]|uniref:Telomere zinc finger-associated protein n=1 Tax=Denticeps clupeoides TaxID=299321 RepID=A0AAY4EC84_9TELE|nr:telomere zinc finger-associated protein isoform X2 [Denticeps clupeoides]